MGQTVTLVKQGGNPTFASLIVNGSTNLSGSLYTRSNLNVSGSIFTSGSLVVSGSIIAQSLIVNSTSYYSGSNIFGNSPSNTQVFTGSMYVGGSISGSSFTGSGAGLTSIPNSALTNSTISGISLGSNLSTLTFGTYLTGTSYNGSTGVTIATNATNANTVSTIVARDASGNFSAGTITAALTGNCSGTSNNITAYTINQNVGTGNSPSFVAVSLSGNLTVSTGNTTGGGIILADDGDIVDLNDGYCAMRFSSGVRVHAGNRTGAAVIKLGNGGDIIASSDITAYGSPSDIRLKENIKPLETALDKVLKLQGVTYDWKEGTDARSMTNIKEDIGFIAQQVQEVVPELVRQNDNGFLSLRDKGITALLVEAIKEQQKQIEELKSVINGITK